MGSVFLAEDSVLAQPVCLKSLHPQLIDNAEAKARFTREIVLSRRIHHHGVCRVHDLHDEGGLRFLTMEYIDGAPLRELLGRDAQPMSAVQALRITRNVCRAVAAAHDVGVFHRDLKPRNIMVRSKASAVEADDICILDFGIATATDTAAEALTQVGVTLGTRHYIAPELWQGQAASAQSDLFSVGVIFYNLLVARMPWAPAPGAGDMLEAMLAGPPPAPSRLRPELPPEVDIIASKALAVNPTQRFQDAHTFAKACERALERIAPAPAPLEAGITAIFQIPGGSTQVRAHPVRDTVSQADASSLDAMPTSASMTNEGAPSVLGVAVDDVAHDDSASWVVGGRAVDLPVRPKPRVPSGTDIVVRPLPVGDDDLAGLQPSRGPLLVGGLVVILGLAAGAAWWSQRSTDDRDAPPAIATGADAGVTAGLSDVDAGEAVDVTGAAADAGTASADEGGAVSADAGFVDDVVSADADAGVGADTNPDADAFAASTPAPSPSVPKPRAKGPGSKNEATRAERDVRAAMAAKGVLVGDDRDLDRLNATARQRFKRRRYDDAVASSDAAIARVAEISVDRAFVQRKLTRFNARFDAVRNPERRARLDDLVAAASIEFAAGRYDAANTKLNTAFQLLR